MKSCALVPSPVSYYSQNKTNINDAISTRLVEPPVRIWAFVFFSFFTLVFTNGTLCVLLNKSLVFFRAAPAKQKTFISFGLCNYRSGIPDADTPVGCRVVSFCLFPSPRIPLFLFYFILWLFILFCTSLARPDVTPVWRHRQLTALKLQDQRDMQQQLSFLSLPAPLPPFRNGFTSSVDKFP